MFGTVQYPLHVSWLTCTSGIGWLQPQPNLFVMMRTHRDQRCRNHHHYTPCHSQVNETSVKAVDANDGHGYKERIGQAFFYCIGHTCGEPFRYSAPVDCTLWWTECCGHTGVYSTKQYLEPVLHVTYRLSRSDEPNGPEDRIAQTPVQETTRETWECEQIWDARYLYRIPFDQKCRVQDDGTLYVPPAWTVVTEDMLHDMSIGVVALCVMGVLSSFVRFCAARVTVHT